MRRELRKGRWAPLVLLAAAAVLAPAGSTLWPAGTFEDAGPGITERTGEVIPADIVAVDERGTAVRLVDLLDRPVILALVYYSCEHVCPLVLGALGELASNMALAPGREYRLITLSFDAADTPADAAVAKANYAKPLGPTFPADGWLFLTASSAAIDRLTRTLGFRFEPDSHGFIHPSVLVIIRPGGRIARYLHVSRTAYGVGYPVTFPPLAIAEALGRAGDGGAPAPDPAPLLFCYPHEPPAQSRFYALMSALGAGTLVLLAAFFVYVSVLWKRPRPGAGGS